MTCSHVIYWFHMGRERENDARNNCPSTQTVWHGIIKNHLTKRGLMLDFFYSLVILFICPNESNTIIRQYFLLELYC